MSSKSVFNSVKELNAYCGNEVKLPDNILEDCNVLCFHVNFIGEVKFFREFKEDKQGFFGVGSNGKWEKCSESLEDEISKDSKLLSKYIYVRLATKDNSDVFTPDCLVGVETNYGYVTSVLSINWFSEYLKPSLYVYTTESLSKEDLIDVHTLKYYISDESDETVSFIDYVNMFYDGVY